MRKTAKIYYTSDVHGYLFPSAYTERSEKPAGLLNCIANYQKDGNTLVLDGGDTLQGRRSMPLRTSLTPAVTTR